MSKQELRTAIQAALKEGGGWTPYDDLQERVSKRLGVPVSRADLISELYLMRERGVVTTNPDNQVRLKVETAASR